jgi:hypothetical protein
VRHEDIPEINNPKIRFPVLEGDKLMKEVLNGGYNVHPVPPPNSEIKERIRRRYERERIFPRDQEIKNHLLVIKQQQKEEMKKR